MRVNKTKLIVGMMIFFSIMLVHNNVRATGVQANKTGDRLNKQTPIQFLEQIRQMETSGGTLGKDAEIDTTNYLEIGTGNGIDCHMVKNTEWGTAAILAGSEYGYRTSDNNSSTGENGSGLYQMVDSFGTVEAVAWFVAGKDRDNDKLFYTGFQNADRRYYNKGLAVSYESDSIPGDGMELDSKYFEGNRPVLNQGISVGRGFKGLYGFSNWWCDADAAFFTRATVVCGSGL